MNGLSRDEEVTARVRTSQIIVGTLLLGVAVFAAVATFLRAQQAAAPADPPTVSLMAVGFAVIAFFVRAVVLRTMTAAVRTRLAAAPGDDVRPWLQAHASLTIVGATVLEGAAFFLLVAFLVEGALWAVAAAAVVWLALAWLQFPTRERVERWVSEQRDTAQRERLGA